MDDFGKLSYKLLVNHFSKTPSERVSYDFSHDCAKLIEIFSGIAGEPLDEIDCGQVSLQDLIKNEEDQQSIVNQQDLFDMMNVAGNVEPPKSNVSDENDSCEIKLLTPPVPVDCKFRRLFPHVAECYDQLSSGEIHLDGQYDDINDMWNEASVACLVNPAEFERTKSMFTQSLIKYLIDSNHSAACSGPIAATGGRDTGNLLNLMSWYFAGYYTAKLEC
ncbi:hypothetical protein BmR1_04g09780 [Babesia microti strain RI]|uniref:Uncharacterized protein n=1 Tax=Babesia microti (strain RI) TaxID=1133968 RepID=A0A1N6LYH8_BABMR|nr:hypothetical protein BmR1_04g09780 [Babesia microti strain RI]SIO73922.1 hypothetical protein BmR1_04g09780 [Babesia microti strain RI]|eukprot:XP_012650531.2 hypothetical protein BmR1_04g09780 [Babesia microti strain RI]